MPHVANGGVGFNRLGLVRAYRAHGWTHLHPIIPPQPVDEHRLWRLREWNGWSEEHGRKVWAERFGGKCPGAMGPSGNWYPIPGMRSDNLVAVYREIEARDTELGQNCLRAWANGAGIGVSGTWWPAIDVDIRDVAEAEAVRACLSEFFGAGFFARVGQAPKFAVPFRLPEGHDPIGGLADVRPGRGKRKVEQIEIIGGGRQWVAEGTHGGTGQPYAWAGRPWVDRLPVLDEEALRTLLEVLTDDVLALPRQMHRVRVWVPTPRTGRIGAPGSVAKTLTGPEWLVREVLEAWPNTRAVPRSQWVNVGRATWGASIGAEWGRALFRAWSRGYPHYNEHSDEHLWAGFKDTDIGLDWLIAKCPLPGVKRVTQQMAWLLALDEWRKRGGGDEPTRPAETQVVSGVECET